MQSSEATLDKARDTLYHKINIIIEAMMPNITIKKKSTRGEASTAKSQERRHMEKREKLIKTLAWGLGQSHALSASVEASKSIRIVKVARGTYLGLWPKKSVWYSMTSKESMEMSCLNHSL